MTEGQLQEEFARCLGLLLVWAYQQRGYGIRGGEWWRPQVTADYYASTGAGIKGSVHEEKLAVDLTLTLDGVVQPDTPAYSALGTYWKSLHPSARWGGDFVHRPDGNHFSFEFQGRM